MSDGHRSGRSTGRVSCKSTELKRCSMTEMRWNKYEVSLTTQIRRPSSEMKSRVVELKTLRFSTATGLGWVGSHFPAHVMGWVAFGEEKRTHVHLCSAVAT